MRIAIPVTVDDRVDDGWGRAPRVAIATVEDGGITNWEVHEVGWDVVHDEGTEGSHHARVVRFLRDNNVDAVVVRHLGSGMLHTLGKLGVAVVTAQAQDARRAVTLAASQT